MFIVLSKAEIFHKVKPSEEALYFESADRTCDAWLLDAACGRSASAFQMWARCDGRTARHGVGTVFSRSFEGEDVQHAGGRRLPGRLPGSEHERAAGAPPERRQNGPNHSAQWEGTVRPPATQVSVGFLLAAPEWQSGFSNCSASEREMRVCGVPTFDVKCVNPLTARTIDCLRGERSGFQFVSIKTSFVVEGRETGKEGSIPADPEAPHGLSQTRDGHKTSVSQ